MTGHEGGFALFALFMREDVPFGLPIKHAFIITSKRPPAPATA